MDLKEIKKIARLFDMVSDYENIPEVVNYMMNDCGFKKTEIIELVRDIKNSINLFLIELIQITTKAKDSNLQKNNPSNSFFH